MIITLEWPADNVPDFFFVPCAPFTHEPRGKCIDGVWRITFTEDELALLLEMNKYGKTVEQAAQYEEAAHRLYNQRRPFVPEEIEDGADF